MFNQPQPKLYNNNRFQLPDLNISEQLLPNNQILRVNLELNKSHMRQLILTTNQYKRLRQFLMKKDSQIIMLSNIRLNIFHILIPINMSIIFHKKEYTTNKWLKKDNNKELNIKPSKDK